MKKKRTKRAKIKRIANLKRNPSGMLEIGKKALPGGAALLVTLFASSRLEAVVSGAGLTARAPAFATASKLQKIVAIVAPAAMVVLAHFVTKKWMARHRVPILVGAGAAAALRYVGMFLSYRQAAALPAGGRPQAQGVYEGATESFFGLPAGKVTSRVKSVEPAADDPDDIDDLSLDGADDPQHGDLFTGNFGTN